MNEHNEFFEQLRRGARPPSGNTVSSLRHRIPHDVNEAVGQVRRLLRDAEDELFEIVETIGNILRWHDRDEILTALGEKERALWLVLKEVAPPPSLEE